MKNRPWILLLAAACLCAVAVHARAKDQCRILPQVDGVNCDVVRAYVAHYGESRALLIALKHGMTLEQINRARKCL